MDREPVGSAQAVLTVKNARQTGAVKVLPEPSQ
jgi:hypothetical protein